MRRIVLSSALAASFLVAVAASPALALNARTLVSAVGDDLNPCTRTQPCLTFQHAHDVTQPGGVIEPITPGGYGSLTITRSIQILNGGVGNVGLFPPVDGVGITINAGPSDEVVIEGLQISGFGNQNSIGIVFNTGWGLTLNNCNFVGLAQGGIYFKMTSGTAYYAIEDSSFIANGTGVGFFPPSGSPTFNGVIRNSLFKNNSVGVEPLYSGITSIDQDTFIQNGLAIYRSSTAVVYLRKSNVSGNSNGVYNVGGTVCSYGDNNVNGNSAGDVFKTMTPVALK